MRGFGCARLAERLCDSLEIDDYHGKHKEKCAMRLCVCLCVIRSLLGFRIRGPY